MSRLPPTEFREDDVAVLRIPDTPKSINQVGQRGSWRAVHGEKKRWQDVLERYLLMARLPRPLPHFLTVDCLMVFPRLHRRDEGNFKSPLEKALGDALVNGQWLPDDTPRWWEFQGLRFSEERGPNTTILTLDYRRESDR